MARKVIGAITIILMVSWMTFNIIKNNKFWEASLVNIVTLFMAIFISFILNQKNNEQYKKNHNIDKIIDKIQNEIQKDVILKCDTNDERSIALTYQKSIINKLRYVNDEAPKDIKDDISYLIEQFEDLRSLFGENMIDNNKMKKVANDIEKVKVNLCDRCDKIHLTLLK